MLSVSPNCIVRSSLEEMLEALQRRDESEMPRDVPPALPRRAVIRSRPPSFKRRLPVTSFADENEESSECCVKKGGVRGINKIVVALDDSRQQALQLQHTLEQQKGSDHHDDRQNHHELNRIVVTFQSYVRGEIARKEYGALLRLKEQDNRDSLDHPETFPPVVEELQKRVSVGEATLEPEQKESESLRETEQQYEANMESAEETWQKQITSLQMVMAEAQKSTVVAESTAVVRGGSQSPCVKEKNEGFNPSIDGVKEFELVKVSFEESRAVVEVKNSHYVSPMEKLRRLKRTIKAWIKDHKVRYRDSKRKVHTVGDNEATDGPWKSWWGKKSKRA